MELVQNFKDIRSGSDFKKLKMYVGHDGSMIRLASGLGFGRNGALRWPAMGSEIILEVSTTFILFILLTIM
jgi:2-phosphoxylose phosphatase